MRTIFFKAAISSDAFEDMLIFPLPFKGSWRAVCQQNILITGKTFYFACEGGLYEYIDFIAEKTALYLR